MENELLKNIKLIVLDVDGTLTNGSIYINSQGIEMKSFNVKDGMAIAQAINNGIECAIITGRISTIVEIRAKELGIKYVYQGVHDKLSKMYELSESLNITNEEIAYVGDDINDLACMKVVGFSACPIDAVKEVKGMAHYTSEMAGGQGAVRDIIEKILEEKGLWENIVQKYQGYNQ